MDVLTSYDKSIRDIIERTRRSVPKLPDPQWFHVFFIYKTILPDKDIVTKLLQNLEVLGYKCGNHKNDFVPGKTVIQNVHDCLQKSLTLVILLSKEFCLSEWCKYDLEVAQNLKLKKGQKLQIIPLVLDDCDIPDLISHTTYLEVDMENIDAWHGRFLRTVYESMNVDNTIFHSSSSSSICNGSSVRCFQCGISLFDWSPEDDPEFEHARWSPKCPYIIAKQGQQYIDLVGEAVTEVEVDEDFSSLEVIWKSLKEKLPDARGLSSSLASSPKWKSLSSLSLYASSESLPSASPETRKRRDIFKSAKWNNSPFDSGLHSTFGSEESFEVLPTRIPPRRCSSFRDVI